MLKKIFIILALSFVTSIAIAYMFYLWAARSDMTLSWHPYFALGLGLFFTFVVAAGLSMLAFISARLGHDDDAHNAGNNEPN